MKNYRIRECDFMVADFKLINVWALEKRVLWVFWKIIAYGNRNAIQAECIRLNMKDKF